MGFPGEFGVAEAAIATSSLLLLCQGENDVQNRGRCRGHAAADATVIQPTDVFYSPRRTFTLSLEAFEDHGHTLSSSDTHRFEAELLVVGGQVVQQCRGDARSGHAEGVTKCDRAARDVELVLIDVQLSRRPDHLNCERFVDLDEVDVGDVHSGAGEGPLGRLNRAQAHYFG